MELDTRKAGQVVGALMLLPLLWGAVSSVLKVYDQWIALNQRVERVERWKCAMGNKLNPADIDWQRECRPRN